MVCQDPSSPLRRLWINAERTSPTPASQTRGGIFPARDGVPSLSSVTFPPSPEPAVPVLVLKGCSPCRPGSCSPLTFTLG